MASRFAPDIPLPAYRHVPGVTPHPLSDAAGHSHGKPPVEASRCFLYGIDLFEAGFYWEAHEAWETLWRAAQEQPERDFLKGLIQLAVAGVKHYQALPEGVTRHARRAAELWRGTKVDRWLGLCVGELIGLAERVVREGWPGERPALRPD